MRTDPVTTALKCHVNVESGSFEVRTNVVCTRKEQRCCGALRVLAKNQASETRFGANLAFRPSAQPGVWNTLIRGEQLLPCIYFTRLQHQGHFAYVSCFNINSASLYVSIASFLHNSLIPSPLLSAPHAAGYGRAPATAPLRRCARPLPHLLLQLHRETFHTIHIPSYTSI